MRIWLGGRGLRRQFAAATISAGPDARDRRPRQDRDMVLYAAEAGTT
jgi:hypothetical protein